MKKIWGSIVLFAVLAALLLWAASGVSTGVAQLLGWLDGVTDHAGVPAEEGISVSIPVQAEFELSDQDYDAITAQADAAEEAAPAAQDYLTDGDEMIRVDQTIEELSDE